MQNNPHTVFNHFICIIFASYGLLGYSPDSLAWAPDGHNAIGILAVSQLHPVSRRELETIVGPLDEKALIEACNWSDEIRETEEWEWSSVLHYINIPRGDFTYLQSRDCPEQQCVTEAIKHHATGLADHQASQEQRWQSFAWLCHLVGDLHQPLHSGYADDRGGNDFDIIFKNEPMNLHTFWDFELIDNHAGSWQKLVDLLSTSPAIRAGSNWSPEMVNDWTNESHRLTEKAVYPDDENINEIYLQQSWEHAQKQLNSAASRLALIINTVLQNQE